MGSLYLKRQCYVSSIWFIYLIIYLYPYKLIGIYFILWIIVKCYVLCCSNCSSFGFGLILCTLTNLFNIGFFPPVLLYFLAHTSSYSMVILYISCPIPRIMHFTKEPRFFSLENRMKNQIWVLEVLVAVEFSLLLGPHTERIKKYVHIFYNQSIQYL